MPRSVCWCGRWRSWRSHHHSPEEMAAELERAEAAMERAIQKVANTVNEVQQRTPGDPS